MGGAVFVGDNGRLTVNDCGTDAGAVIGGSGGAGGGVATAGTAGTGAGSAFFVSSDTTLSVGTGSRLIAGSIADPASSGVAGLLAARITKEGSGLLVLTGGNTYRGDTYIEGGTLQVGDNVSNTAGLIGTNYVWVDASTEFNLRPSPTAVMTIRGTVDVVGSARLQGPGTVSFGGLGMGGSVDLGSCLLEVGSNNSSNSFWGVISDGGLGGSLTKVGTGTLMLSGHNSYLGTTTVEDGTLQVLPTGSIADSGVIDAGGGHAEGGLAIGLAAPALRTGRGWRGKGMDVRTGLVRITGCQVLILKRPWEMGSWTWGMRGAYHPRRGSVGEL